VVRPMSFLLGFWLATVFVVAQNGHMPTLVTLTLGIGAAFAIIGGMIAPIVPSSVRMIWAVTLSLGLFALTLAAVLLHLASWFTFCIFVSTAIFLAVVIAERVWSPRDRGTMAPSDS
jgi:hypothetical protein